MSEVKARPITVWVCPACGDLGECYEPGQECEACAESDYKPVEYVPAPDSPDREPVLCEVVDALERAYHPQNPCAAHPADFIIKRFELSGHEGIDLTRWEDRADRSDGLRAALEELADAAQAVLTGWDGEGPLVDLRTVLNDDLRPALAAARPALKAESK